MQSQNSIISLDRKSSFPQKELGRFLFFIFSFFWSFFQPEMAHSTYCLNLVSANDHNCSIKLIHSAISYVH